MGWWDRVLNRPTRAAFLEQVRTGLTQHHSTRSMGVDDVRCTLTLDLDASPRVLELEDDYREFCRAPAQLRSRWLAQLTEMIRGELGPTPDEPVVEHAGRKAENSRPSEVPLPSDVDTVRVHWGWAGLSVQERVIARRTQAWIMVSDPRPLDLVVDRLTAASRDLRSRKLIARFTGMTAAGLVQVRMRFRNGVRTTNAELEGSTGGVDDSGSWDDSEVEQHLDREDFEAAKVPSVPFAVRWSGVQLEDLDRLNTRGEPRSLLLQRVWEVEGPAIRQARSLGEIIPPHREATKPLHMYFRIEPTASRELHQAALVFGCTADEVALAAVLKALSK